MAQNDDEPSVRRLRYSDRHLQQQTHVAVLDEEYRQKGISLQSDTIARLTSTLWIFAESVAWIFLHQKLNSELSLHEIAQLHSEHTQAFNRANRRWYNGPYSTADSNLRGAFERKEIEAYDKDGHPVSRFAQLGRDPPYRFESEAVRKLWPRPDPSSIDVLHLLKEDKRRLSRQCLKSLRLRKRVARNQSR